MTLLPSKDMPSLVQAASSEHLFPEATATRKMVLRKRSSREAVLFLNLGLWRVSKAWFRDHLGIFFLTGGERWNWDMPLSEDCEVFRKPVLEGSPSCLCMVDRRFSKGVN